MMCRRPLVHRFLCHLPLRTGAVFTGHLMCGVFALCGAAFAALMAWWSHFYDDLVAAVGTTPPGEDTNDMLDALYPHFLGVATALFLLYSLSSALLVYGVKREFFPFVRLFLFVTAATVAACLAGHLYIFCAFQWHDTKQLAVVVSVNAAWYLWWAYCFVVVLSWYVEAYSFSELAATAGDGGAAVGDASPVRLPAPPSEGIECAECKTSSASDGDIKKDALRTVGESEASKKLVSEERA